MILSIAMALLSLQTVEETRVRPGKVVSKVEVDGYRFKVTQKGNSAFSERVGKFMYKADGPHFMASKKAIEIATGCRVTDTFPQVANMNAALDCASR